MKVIIVDDDLELGNLLKVALQVGFYAKAKALARNHQKLTDSLDVHLFSDQGAAFQYLEQAPDRVDLIFTEVNTLGMHDFEFIRACRNQIPEKFGEIIVVTDRDDKQDIKAALQAGAKDYILKPFEPEDLMEHVFHAWNQPGSTA